jgi:hypothetical protein
MRPARGLAFQDAADLVDLADVTAGDPADDGAAIGQQVDKPGAGQLDERLADRRVTESEALGQFLRDQALTGAQPALKDLGQQRLDDELAALAVVTLEALAGADGGHGVASSGKSGGGWTQQGCGRGRIGHSEVMLILAGAAAGWQEDSVEFGRDSGQVEAGRLARTLRPGLFT